MRLVTQGNYRYMAILDQVAPVATVLLLFRSHTNTHSILTIQNKRKIGIYSSIRFDANQSKAFSMEKSYDEEIEGRMSCMQQ